MQSVCGRCGNETSPTARFCRQCGAPLFVESDAAKSATRQYAPQYPQYPPQYQAAAPIDATPPEYLKHDTARLYEPPPAGRYTAAVPPRPKSSKAAVWFVMIFLVLMCFAAIGLLVVPRVIRRAIHEDQPIVSVGPPMPQAIPAPPAPPPPPPAPGAPAGRISSIDQLVYPGATIVNRIRVMGQEVLQMHSKDNIDAIKNFYTQRLGAAVVENEENKAVFMLLSGAGKTLVTIEPDEEDSSQISIKAVRTNLPISIPK